MEVLRKYGVTTSVRVPLITAGANDFDSTPLTFAAGDIKVSKDGAAFANVAKSASHIGNGIYQISLTATEVTARTVVVTFIDSATKTWEDQAVIISTYGNASAEHAFDLDTATQSVTVTTNSDKTGYSISGTKTTLDALNDVAATDIVSSGAITTSSGAVSNVTTVGSVTGAVGSVTGNVGGNVTGSVGSISGITFPTNFADMAITVTTGEITVGTNNDKTGYGVGTGGITAASFAAGAVDAAALAADAGTEIAAAVTGATVEAQGSYTLAQTLSICLSALAGVTASSGLTFKTPNGVATRIAATTDASNNRTAMTLTP